MQGGDFYDSEKCMTMEKDCDVKMELLTKSGETIVLKEKTSLLKDEIIDITPEAVIQSYDDGDWEKACKKSAGELKDKILLRSHIFGIPTDLARMYANEED